jgi:phosphoglycerate dehydrogenase-like enzyme
MRIAFRAPSAEFTRQILEQLKNKLPDDTLIEWQPEDTAPPEGVEVLLALGPVTRETLESLPGLVLVQTLSDGYESVDIQAATESGAWVSYAPADITGNADSVAEFAVLLLLAAVRRVGVAMASIRANARDRQLPVPSLMRKTVCIVGPGTIGSRIAQRLLPFGVRLTGVDRHPLHAPKEMATRPLEELKEAVAEADFVMFCVRATKENTHMIDAGVLAAMKKGAVVVNIARGTLIDEQALYEAVKSGHISGAGLDVLEHEPMQPDDPLLTLPQIIVTPHVAGVTDLMLEGTADYLIEVIGKLKKAEKFSSLLNEPRSPRWPLHG